MSRIPLDSLGQQKRELLANSQTTPPIYIFIEKYHYEEGLKAVIYDCQIGIQDNTDVIIRIVKTRFSDLAALRPFPPKRWFGNTDDAFLSRRRMELQEYLASLTRVSGILREHAFRKFAKISH
jgi:hypothetical protein